MIVIVTVTEEPDDLVDAAVEEYLRRVDDGEAVDQASFLAAHPDSMDALRSFFDTLCLINLLAGRSPAAVTHPPRVGDSSIAESQSTPQMPWTSLPAVFGRYFVEKLIGCGGMGAVYRAHDTQLDRPVALKLAHVLAQESPELRERLLKEARAAAGLGHPNICRVYDVGEIDGVRFIAMELIEGQPLSDLIRSGPLPTQTTVTIVRKLALALQAAHDKGIVHRDLKPSNVIVRKDDDEPVLMDFGLAHRPVITGEERLTQVGTLVGSPAYMSPEQVRADADAIGPATDVYGLGVVFYELLTRQLPFTGSVLSILAKVLAEEPPPPHQLRPEIDQGLSDICCKMLAKRSEDRFGSMIEVAEALEILPSARSDSSSDSVPQVTAYPVPTSFVPNPRHRIMIKVSAALVLGCVVVGLGVWASRRVPPQTTGSPVTLAVMDFDNHSRDPALDGFRLGFRDMLVTDLSQIASLKVLDRARLTELLREHDLTKTPFIDASSAVQLGRGLSAKALVSGSYVIAGEDIRIDIRMVSVETGEILLAKGLEGKKSDLFGLQRRLAQQVLNSLKITPTDVEKQSLQLNGINDYEAFRLFSDARLAQVRGQRDEAERQYRASLATSSTFQLATRELSRLENEALFRLSEESQQRSVAAGEIARRLTEHRLAHQQVVTSELRDADYFTSLLVLAAHAGLAGEYDQERKLIIKFWYRFRESVPPENAGVRAGEIRTLILREGKFFQDNIDSGDYTLAVRMPTLPEISLPGFDGLKQRSKFSLPAEPKPTFAPEAQYLRPELRDSLRWPRWTAIWPLNAELRGLYGHWKNSLKIDDEWFERFPPQYPHDYLEEVLKEFLSSRYQQADEPTRFSEDLRLLCSILSYYARTEQMPVPARKKMEGLHSALVSKLESLESVDGDAGFLRDTMQALEFLGKTSSDPKIRDRANRLLIRFSQQIRVDAGVSTPATRRDVPIEFCGLSLKGDPVIFIWAMTDRLSSPGSFGDEQIIRRDLSDVIRALPDEQTFNILWTGGLELDSPSRNRSHPGITRNPRIGQYQKQAGKVKVV